MEKKSKIKACRICLKTTCQLYRLRTLGLANTYTMLSGAPLEDTEPLPQTVCTPCAMLLRKARQLAIRCKRANTLLKSKLKHATVEQDVKVEDLDDDIKAEEPIDSIIIAENQDTSSFNYLKSEDNIDNDIFKSEEPLDVDSSKDDVIDRVVFKVEPIDNVSDDDEPEPEIKFPETPKSYDTDNEIDQSDSCLEDVKEETTKKKKGRIPKEKKKAILTKKQQWKAGLEEKARIINENFKVQELTLEEQISELEKAKLRTNYTKSPYKCNKCFRGFKEEPSFNSHMVKHTEANGQHECPVCHLFFQLRDAYGKHLYTHKIMYTCKACPHQTQNKKQVFKHIEWHRGTVFRCDQCPDAVFEFETSLRRHVRDHHRTAKSCVLCGIGLKDDRGLKMHYDWKHGGTPIAELPPDAGPRCQECQVTFANEKALAKHRRLQHDRSIRIRGDDAAETRFSCDDCGEGFAARYLFRKHLWQAHGRAPPLLKRGHGPDGTSKATVTPGPAASRYPVKQCHICGKTFSCVAVLRNHMDEHDESVSYACPDCGKKFKTRNRMRNHRHSHTKRWGCPVCERTFNCQGNRNRHYKNVHKATKDVKCGYCPKAFTSPDQHRQHELHVHLEKAWPTRVKREQARGLTSGQS